MIKLYVLQYYSYINKYKTFPIILTYMYKG